MFWLWNWSMNDENLFFTHEEYWMKYLASIFFHSTFVYFVLFTYYIKLSDCSEITNEWPNVIEYSKSQNKHPIFFDLLFRFFSIAPKKISIKSQKEPKLKFKLNLEIIRWNYSMKIRIRKGSFQTKSKSPWHSYDLVFCVHYLYSEVIKMKPRICC